MKKEILSHSAFICFIATLLIFFASCENNPVEVHKVFEKSVGRDEGQQVIIHYSIGAKKKALLNAPIMYRVMDSVTYIDFPKSIHVDFFDKDGKTESILNAHYAKYNDGQSKIFLKDSVTVINILGDTLYCNELYWDRARTGEEFYTDKPVRIRRKTEVIDGVGMTARQDFKEWMIVRPVGLLKVPKSSFPEE